MGTAPYNKFIVSSPSKTKCNIFHLLVCTPANRSRSPDNSSRTLLPKCRLSRIKPCSSKKQRCNKKRRHVKERDDQGSFRFLLVYQADVSCGTRRVASVSAEVVFFTRSMLTSFVPCKYSNMPQNTSIARVGNFTKRVQRALCTMDDAKTLFHMIRIELKTSCLRRMSLSCLL